MSSKSNDRLEKIKFVLIFLTALLVFVFGILGFKEKTGDAFNIFGAIYSTICLILYYKYGPLVSDKAERYVLKDVLKIHNQLIPYDKLTEIEKGKDLNLFLLLPLLSRIYKSN